MSMSSYLKIFVACQGGLDVNPGGPLGEKGVGDELQQCQASRGIAHRNRPQRHNLVGPNERNEVEYERRTRTCSNDLLREIRRMQQPQRKARCHAHLC